MPATPTWPPKSTPRLFVDALLDVGGTVTLDGPQAHYLARVMRLGPGDAVILCDDRTGEWASQVANLGKREVALAIAGQLRPREQVPDFTLCAALLKKDRFDLVLEKACELGVRRIQPVLTRRCVADKLNLERARAILVEAAEQCARTALPELAPPMKLEALLKGWDPARVLFFADENGGEMLRSNLRHFRVPPRCSPAPKAGSTRPSAPPCARWRKPAPFRLGRESCAARPQQ